MFGACWLACHLYEQLGLDAFWKEHLADSREGTCWGHIVQALVCYRLIDPGIIDARLVLNMLGGKRAYQRFMNEAIEEGHKQEYYEVEDQRFLGSEGFAEDVRKHLAEKDVARTRKPLRRMLDALAKKLGVDEETLRGADRSWRISRARAVLGYVLVRRLGYRLIEVATCLGRDTATVSSLLSRLGERMDSDSDLEAKIDRLREDCLD